jgi:hypothetical protein
MIARESFSADAAVPARWQFSVSSLLWLTVTAAMCLAYARPFGVEAMSLVVVAPLAAAIVGLCFLPAGRVELAVYWAVVGAMLGALCVIPAHVNPLTFVFWPAVGALAGAYCGTWLPRVTWRGWLAALFLGALFFMRFQTPFGMGGDNEFLADLAFSPLVCVSLAVLIRVVEWLRTKYHTSRDLWAAGLVFAVIAGNVGAAIIGGRSF